MALVGPQQVDIGHLEISSTGIITVTTGFKPDLFEFQCAAAVEGFPIDASGTGGSEASNFGGYATGYAKWDGTEFTQATVSSGGSGNSINNSSRYGATGECLTMRYASQNGGSQGYTRLVMDSLNPDGFDVEVTTFSGTQISTEVVIYKAYRTQDV